MAAIAALKQIEAENRFATSEEQHILSQYVGWGGIPDAFDENKADWEREYTELKNSTYSERIRFCQSKHLKCTLHQPCCN